MCNTLWVRGRRDNTSVRKGTFFILNSDDICRILTFDTIIDKIRNMKYAYLFNGKIKKIIAAAALTGVITVSTSGCGFLPFNIDGYSSKSQVNTIADGLGYNMDYLMTYVEHSGYPRILANDGPIKVTIDDQLQEYQPQIEEAVDSMFSLIYDFNQAYTYEIVDNGEYIPETETSIHFKKQEIDEDYVQAHVTNFKMPQESLITENMYIRKADVIIDLDEALSSPMSIYAIALHELAHVFGLGDVYEAGVHKQTDGYIGNTMMHVYLGYKVPMFTPYDVARFAALYTPPAIDNIDLNAKIKYLKKYLNEYTEKYYDFYTQSVKTCVDRAGGKTVEFRDMDLDRDFVFETNVLIKDGDRRWGYNYELEYSDQGYVLKIYDRKNNLLDQCSGEVLYVNGVLVLRNVQLRQGMRPDDPVLHNPKGYIQDLTLYSDGDGVQIYDVADNNIMYGTIHYLENEVSVD